jgi:hypothetical protein
MAIVLAKKVAASTESSPNLNLIEKHLLRESARFLSNVPDLTPGHLYLIGELRIANRHQCRFLPEAARNDKEAVFNNTGKHAQGLSPSGCTKPDNVL